MQESNVTLANVMEMNIDSTKKPVWHQNSAKSRHTSAFSDLSRSISLDFTIYYRRPVLEYLIFFAEC